MRQKLKNSIKNKQTKSQEEQVEKPAEFLGEASSPKTWKENRAKEKMDREACLQINPPCSEKAEEKTRGGSRRHNVKVFTKQKIIEVMTDTQNDGKTQKEIAALVGVTENTLRNYLTPNLWEEIKAKRLKVLFYKLEAVDSAVFEKALKGDTQAAKMIYARWDERRQQETALPQEMSVLDQELEEIREQIRNLENAADA